MNNTVHKYINVMEELVEAEVNKQLQNLPDAFIKYRKYLNPIEIQTYALNHLPPLYASSVSGKVHQIQKGQIKLTEQIQTTVTRAIASVLKDPLRQSEPLLQLTPTECTDSIAQKKLEQLEKAISNLQVYLQENHLIKNQEKISADNLLKVIRVSLRQATLPMDEVLQDLQEYLSNKNLIETNCQIHLDNLLQIMCLVINKIIITNNKARFSDAKNNDNLSDLEFYLSRKNENQFEENEGKKNTESISQFGQMIRDNLSGKVKG